MKARVKETGKIVDVIPYNKDGFAYIQDDGETVYEFHELEILDDPDYWTKLEHQYAGMFMKSFLDNFDGTASLEQLTESAIDIAHALIQKLKEKEK
jgi:hypothetical protein